MAEWIRKGFKLSPDAARILREGSELLGISETAVVELALRDYLTKTMRKEFEALGEWRSLPRSRRRR